MVWFQGCTLGCPGCFNPATHPSEGGFDTDTTALADELRSLSATVEGVSFSGGEPFQQPRALLHLVEQLAPSALTILVFTGYTYSELQKLPLGPQILEHLDVIIAGRYVQSKHLGQGLLGSANQQIHLLTDRYTHADFTGLPPCELILHADGSITITGVSPQIIQARD